MTETVEITPCWLWNLCTLLVIVMSSDTQHLHPNSTFEIRARKINEEKNWDKQCNKGGCFKLPFWSIPVLWCYLFASFRRHLSQFYHNFVQLILQIESIFCALYSLRNYRCIFDKKWKWDRRLNCFVSIVRWCDAANVCMSSV
jgi:hypothetical protein